MEVFIFYFTRVVSFCCLTAIAYVIAPQKDEQSDDWEE
ncbi:hypothetical protein M2273_003094 [Mucilaginibacter lappiensis]